MTQKTTSDDPVERVITYLREEMALDTQQIGELTARLAMSGTDAKQTGEWGNPVRRAAGALDLEHNVDHGEGRDLQLSLYHGADDGVPVIQVDTDGSNSHFRINVNDGTIWDQGSEDDRNFFPDPSDRQRYVKPFLAAAEAAEQARGRAQAELEALRTALEAARRVLR